LKELALHILDIAQNSVRAKAKIIEINIWEDITVNLFKIEIKDDGIGMDEETLKIVDNPFYTTRTTRKVGLGLSLLKAASIQSNGNFKIETKKNVGTTIIATFQHNHIDRAPLGNIVDTLITLFTLDENINFIYNHYYNDKKFTLDTREIKKILNGVPINDIGVLNWLREYLDESLLKITKP